MLNINRNYRSLKESYLFSEIAHRVAAFGTAHPVQSIIRMGIGDVTLPLCPAVTEAMQRAAAEMAHAESFRGYGPEQGYDFLREKIRDYYASHGVALAMEEIFVSDGAKSDLGNILDLFDTENTVLIPDPVYPVYVDTNLMAGRSIRYMKADPGNDFLPMPDEKQTPGLIYLCSPNNPTGAVYRREQLTQWVEYAQRIGAIILFDAAYEAFITDEALPRSIFEIPGAETCAIEFCSFSKTAGFTGVRCGYTVVPQALQREGFSLNRMWLRRQTTKFNGVSYIVQRGAEAVFTKQGQSQVRANIDYYRKNACTITAALDALGIRYSGGKNSPYIWLECPGKMTSWEFFDALLTRAGVVGTPGAGFGQNGEGFFRLTAFSGAEQTQEAMQRLAKLCADGFSGKE